MEKRKLYSHSILLISLLFFLIPLFLFGGTPACIFIDGDFSDWDNIRPVYSDPAGDVADGQIDFGKVWIADNTNNLFLRFEINEERILQSDSNVSLYIDTDNSNATGYKINNIGAEIVWNFSSRSGMFYYASTNKSIKWPNLDLISSASYSDSQFEVSISKSIKFPNNSSVFSDSSIRILLQSKEGSKDIAPNTGEYINYTFSAPYTPLLPPKTLAKYKNTDIRMITWNMLWDGLFERTTYFSRILSALDPEIIAFQEVGSAHEASDILPILNSSVPPPSGFSWHIYKSSGDSAVASIYPVIKTADSDGNMIALIQLPERETADELLFISVHFPCCSDETGRQAEVDNLLSFIRDSKNGLGTIPLKQGTPFIITGDTNFVGLRQQIETVLTGNISDEATYGADFNPDWDNSSITKADILHYSEPQKYTWRSDTSYYSPSAIDFIFYTDSVLYKRNSFIFNTSELSAEELTHNNLLSTDSGEASDHMTVVMDFSTVNKSENMLIIY